MLSLSTSSDSILITGNSNVGKTNLASRYASNEFREETRSTIGVDFFHCDVTTRDGTEVKLQLWDTAGQDRFKALSKGYYRGGHAALVVYDVTKRRSFDEVPKWLEELKQFAPKDIIMILVGNKTDLKTMRQVATSEAKKYAEHNGMLFLETSARENDNISQAFQMATNAVHNQQRKKLEESAKDEVPSRTPIEPKLPRPTESSSSYADDICRTVLDVFFYETSALVNCNKNNRPRSTFL
ncbi:ras-related protein Rab-11B-like isoform 2 [Planoprotostelium fungivorum]|uniref:Ras-related protein Rab-11B-like isoform 2 n=1 Tax=Planoprotostelium fungivorum TaxID=1890364 RepID=A0A2P6NRQ4_9EUKA|nr:ras-related protein Rab-11B-like isoform 2 [Planoprotostelium fungivorum]